ncbi:MAG TPA: SDR family oxidoreductase [Burkholderiaceae bacterium]|jgi:3-oxoacyl-[acyl-carrier protein] reductase
MNVLLTGGANGIGESTAYKFAKAGHNVFIVDMDSRGQEVADNIAQENTNVKAWFYKADVSDSDQVTQAVAAMAKLVDGKIDVLVNNAGVSVMVNGTFPLIEQMTDDALQRQFAVNTFSMYYMCRAVVPYMKAAKSGCIVNVASLAVFGLAASSHYSGSKGAVEALSRSLAVELAPDIQVIGIAPGLVDTILTSQASESVKNKFTSQTLTGKFINRWEVANQIVHFANPDNASFTGQIVHFNAGHTRQFK